VWLLPLLSIVFSPPLDASNPMKGNGGDVLVVWKEGRYEVVDANHLQEAFEAYLAEVPIPAAGAQARIQKLREISRTLGQGIPVPSDLRVAYSMLQQLSQDPLDQGACGELLMIIRRISEVFSRQNNAPPNETALRRQQEILSWNIAVGKKYDDLVKAPSLQVKGKQNQKATPSADEQRLSEVTAGIRQMELGGEVTELQVRLELQDLALKLLTRGDYAESILAVRFYRGLFSDREATLRLDPEEKLQLAPSGTSPNLGVIERLAAEADANITKGLADSTALLQGGALVGASKCLSAVFAQGSRTLQVRSFPEDAKEKILLEIRGERKLKQLMEAKDYESALQVLTTLEGQTVDFQGRDYRVAMESGKSVSNIHLAAARKAGLEGNVGEMLDELKKATDCWPKNPGIAPVVADFQGNATIQQAVIEEFDLLYAAHKIKEIAGGKNRFEAALSGLPTRHDEFVASVEEWKAISENSERARELRDFGSLAGAWELAETLCRRYPDQEAPKELRAAMRPGVESLADGLEQATSMERSQPASSLALYLRLQRLYPQSEFASGGVSRMTQQLLKSPGSGTS
jgi:hypothetical protein